MYSAALISINTVDTNGMEILRDLWILVVYFASESSQREAQWLKTQTDLGARNELPPDQQLLDGFLR